MDPEKAQIAVSLTSEEEQDGTRPTAPACTGEGNHTLRSNTSVRIATCDLVAATLCQDRHHRKLAVSSIICGLTCIGIMSLINSVKAREERNPQRAEHYSKEAKKYGILSIVVWVIILIMFPVLVVLVSYLLTLID